MAGKKGEGLAPIIVKKIKKGGGGHHGGAWKVAYADFVTAMMAFFLLLWLLNVTTKEQKNAISNYFDPSHPKVSMSQSGAGGVMGGLSMATEGAMATNVQPLTKMDSTGKPSSEEANQSQQQKAMEQQLKQREDERFDQAKQEIEKEMAESAELQDLAKHLQIDVTPEGLRIQIIDQNGDPMFPSGSAQMFAKTRKLLDLVAPFIIKMPNPVSMRGHTDSHPYAGDDGYSNWELSSDRANATRRALIDDKLPEKRVANVMGKSDTEPFIPKDPGDARNRRISILLMREQLADAIKRGEFGPNVKVAVPAPPPLPAPPAPTFQRTQGAVQFP